jgi:iron complex outermembrane recepter protein
MKKLTAIMFILSMINTPILYAQQRTIKGIVADEAGSPVTKATVKVAGSQRAVFTNNNGEFAILASSGDILEISNVGYQLGNITVGTENFYMVRIKALETTLADVVLVGTRTQGRIKLETPVPVDVVNINQAALPTARMDITSILNFSVPSFNYNKQSGSDGADHIDLATLRGLGPDQTLVLVNGKRRHQTAFVAVFGTRGRGNSGTDLSAIPVGAIDRVEVLRDGASAPG